MIDYFFGKPRTGKTYRAVKIIYDDYLKENSSPKFTNILTNIGGFNFKYVNQLFTDRGSKSLSYKLVWKDFYSHLSVLHKMALDDKNDSELNRYAYSHKINDCLIVIDEASLYLKKYDDVISWFLAYHGHFKIRIILIAQSPKQINSEYLVHAEIYYEAQPQSKQFSNSKLRYIHYSEPYFNKDSKFGSDTISTSKDIYALYKSGEVDKPKKILYRFIFLSVIALIFMIGTFKFLLYRLSPDDSIIKSDNNVSYSDSIYKNSNNFHDSDTILLSLRCDNQYCWNSDNKYVDNTITLSYFKSLVIKYDLFLEYEEVKNEIYTLTPTKKNLVKHTLAKLTDYLYFIPKELKLFELNKLFVYSDSTYKKLNGVSMFDNSLSKFTQDRSEERISDVATNRVN